MSIEDIVLSRDRRGISKLRGHVPNDFCDRAAGAVLDRPGTAVITTGFYILAAGAPETDGPPGAIAIGNALRALDYEVVYVTDRPHVALMTALAGSEARVVDFPIADGSESRRFADDLLDELDPSVLIAIERCGLTRQDVYFNMHMQDISEFTARVDYLFSTHPGSVGIGDGGNEIGMGSLQSVITDVPTLVKMPAVTSTTELILCSVSNWGGYGLVAALSRRVRKNLLPTVSAERDLVMMTTDLGAVDGMSTKQEYRVDGFTLEENSEVVTELHDLLTAEGIRS